MKKVGIFSVFFVFFVIFQLNVVFVDASSASTQKGDILVYGNWEVDQEDPTYSTAMYLAFMASIARDMSVYTSFWGKMRTWDNTSAPRKGGRRCFWGHIDIATVDGYSPSTDGWDVIVILRPNSTFMSVIDLNQMAYKASEGAGAYNQPFYSAFMNWVKRLAKTSNHWLSSPELQQLWLSNYGVDVNAPEIERLQTSPYLGTEYTDINDWRFWKRSMDCSSTVAWAMIWGWYCAPSSGGEQVRSFFLNNLDAVGAVDAIAPGQLAWWLSTNKLVDTVTFFIR
jgi:hypothetical protein